VRPVGFLAMAPPPDHCCALVREEETLGKPSNDHGADMCDRKITAVHSA
jgi:hypothetical protein